jgi:hypothetical protein
MQKRLLPLVVAAGMIAAAGTVVAKGSSQNSDNNVLSIAVFGDAPYGSDKDDTKQISATPGFIDTINKDPDVSLVFHVGDIHSGKQYCSYD